MKYLSIFILILILLNSCEKEETIEDITTENIDSLVLSEDITVYDSLNFYEGYTLVAPMGSKNTYLINMEGFVVNYWESEYYPGNAVNLLDEGRLLRTQQKSNQTFSGPGGGGGGVEIRSFGNELEWDFTFSSDEYCQHHDAIILPNGNIMLIAWELKSKEEAIAAGRDTNYLTDDGIWAEMLVEIEPSGINGGEIVWEWHVWDHLIQDFDESKNNYGDVASHPELIDINYYQVEDADIFHANAVEYIEEFDELIISPRSYSEIWVIDHSTTIEESKLHSGGDRNKGGDLLYRWGNPAVYNCGDSNDQILYGQHNPTWIAGLPGNGGNVLLFNNGDRNSRAYSSADEFELPHDGNGNFTLIANQINGPEIVDWTYTNSDLYSPSISGAQRLENGNTLICEGEDGIFYEVTNDKEIVWQFNNPMEKTNIFRVHRYGLDDPIFENRVLDVMDIEIR